MSTAANEWYLPEPWDRTSTIRAIAGCVVDQNDGYGGGYDRPKLETYQPIRIRDILRLIIEGDNFHDENRQEEFKQGTKK